MPFYEYLCQACGQHHEAMQKMSEAPLKNCPHCGKSKLKRLISAPVFRLKGGGWYETDFKSDKEAKRNLHGEEAKADKAEAADKSSDTAAAQAETKVETKAEAKAEAKPEAKAETKTEATAASKSAAKSSARRTPPRSAKPARRVKRRR
jgi:putative FmdB family regulatory protein